MTPTLKIKGLPAHMTLLDAAVWTVALLLISVLIVLAGVSDPARRGPMIAYLAPAYGGVQNLWVASVASPQDAVELTQAAGGIYNYDVSADGRFIVYSARDVVTGLNDLFLLDIATRRAQPLTACAAENADCRSPAIRPDGMVIAYERMEYSAATETMRGGAGAVRIWLLDMTQTPYSTRPLTDDAQFVGHSPQWAQSGDTLAFYSADIANPGIMVYTFVPRDGEKALKFIPSSNGVVGSLTPNGRKLAFPDIVQTTTGYATRLRVADLDSLQFDFLVANDVPAEDNAAAWHPDGQRLAILRQYTDNRHTPGYHIYLYDPATGDTQPLAYERRYSHGYFAWNATGDKLLYQRFALNQPDARPEVAVRDLTTGETTVVVQNAFAPRWVLP